jgi:hypothetical protein
MIVSQVRVIHRGACLSAETLQSQRPVATHSREGCAGKTPVAPDDVFTVRTYGDIRSHYGPAPPAHLT